MSGTGQRSRVVTRTARADDLPAVLALVRQHRVEAHAEGVLTGQTPGAAAAAGFRRLLADPGYRVVIAVLPGANAPDPGAARTGEVAVGLAVLGLDPLSALLGVPQVTVDNLVVHRDHRRRGVGAALLAAAAAHAGDVGADHVVAAVGGHEAERQRFFARMGFAPLTARRIVPRETLVRSLAAWQRGGVPAPRRQVPHRRPLPRVLPGLGATAEA
ncbi:GNAT family N-acetyltransferase [Geodermatophilus maliterrae]|uniref:GNAT family N-acetyltransferase n=1 Tax=Geodermatophilus maliterrae TaxID=3162531 RepID=A0ABV3XHM9_9ACTN